MLVTDSQKMTDAGAGTQDISQEVLKRRCLLKDRDGHIVETPDQMEAQLEDMFTKAQRAFLESDDNLAREVVETRRVVKNECKNLLTKVMADKTLSPESAASYALLIYYFKRVAAHLFNIASSVLVPITDIGHYKSK